MNEHGTYSRYSSKTYACRCEPCTRANADYHRAHYAELRRLALLGRAMERLVEGRKS
jgi:transposase